MESQKSCHHEWVNVKRMNAMIEQYMHLFCRDNSALGFADLLIFARTFSRGENVYASCISFPYFPWSDMEQNSSTPAEQPKCIITVPRTSVVGFRDLSYLPISDANSCDRSSFRGSMQPGQ
jgi:hypothetical protein